MEQLLIRTPHSDFTLEDPAFGDTGLGQLQIWATQSGAKLFLCSVHDAKAAGEWIKAQTALGRIASVEHLQTV